MNLIKQREMTADQYVQTIAKVGLNISSAGRFLAISERTARRYASGDAEIPAAVAMLLRMMVAQKITVEA